VSAEPSERVASARLGLSSAQAAERLAVEGPNLLPADAPRGMLHLVLDVLREPMFLLLLVATLLYVLLGDVREALVLGGAVLVVIGINVVQEGRTERALSALRDLSTPRAQVLRDGQVVTLPARDLVAGDVIRVAEGDRVPADARLCSGTVLEVDESPLTGESVAVTKLPQQQRDAGSAEQTAIFLGTLVVSGRGTAEVVATGARTALGRIGASLGSIEHEKTPLQREVRGLVRRMAIAGTGIAAAIVLWSGVASGDWIAAALSGITAAMTLLPEEFPVVLTVFLALGARRLAQQRVLTRVPTAIETLGSAHLLCTDKTGTLTQNRMTIRKLRSADCDFEVPQERPGELPESVHQLVEVGILACPRDPFDPMEKAFHELGQRTLADTEHVHPDWRGVREYPLTPQLLAVTHVWHAPGRQGLFVATKGAPEAVFDLCHLDAHELAAWRERVDALANAGLRVLGVARGREALAQSPSHPHDVEFEMTGLVGLHDPLQPGVREAIASCREARIDVMMITGDHPATARAIASEAGIDASRVLSGADLDAMDASGLSAALVQARVIARARPEHKLQIVRAEQARGRVVAMTGDGVNDAPALKAADIGVAMGMRGTAVAREAADLVLTHDDFGAIVSAVRIGRRIYDNLRKAFGYIVAVHVPVAGIALLPVVFGWGALLMPPHVLFLELIIDPACSIVFELEPEEPNVMRRAPRAAGGTLLGLGAFVHSLIVGLLVLAVTLLLVLDARASGVGLEALRTLTFMALVAGNLAMLVTARSASEPFFRSLRRRNRGALVLVCGTLLTVLLVLFLPAGRALFGFAEVPAAALLRWSVAAALPVFVYDLRKLWLTRSA
jgi:P-type Ca2+ transporter type 2C